MDTDKKSEFIPNLTLTPNQNTESAVAVVQPAEEKKEAITDLKELKNEALEFERLSEAEQTAVKEFSSKIDVRNAEQIMNYGSAAQKNISEFSSAALGNVKTKDMDEIGKEISDLVVELRGFNFDEKESKGLLGLFKKARQSIESLKAQYEKAEVNVNKIVEQLENHEIVLLKDIALMDTMYEKNLQYYRELTMYIIAGKLRVKELLEVELPKYQAKAKETGLAEDAQEANDFANLISRFEKKIHDLELTRIVSIQMSPQIRMIQSNDTVMAEKIRSSIVNTIPLWKSQMVLALTMQHSHNAMHAQREVTDVTNMLLEKNAEKLRQGSVEIAKESERSIIDIETLRKANEELIATLEDVKKIQQEGRDKRARAEMELTKIEDELKAKLLEM
ncbi:MAG: toxic anion resistance protein [Clostridiales bacterium]|nr:toxic anion resistance protein [Clostridiales bacterium]